MYTGIGCTPIISDDKDIIWVMSCDIGKRNFAISICEYNIKTLQSYRQYIGNDTKITDNVVKSNKIIMMDLIDFVGYTNATLSQDIYVNIVNYLDRIKPWLDLCSCFVLEKQIKTNPEAISIEQHIYSYLVIKYELTKDIVSFPSKLKYYEMEFPKNIKKKYYRKKWACERIKGILTKSGDVDALKYIFDTHKSKKDDLSDTLLQSYSFCKRIFVKKTI